MVGEIQFMIVVDCLIYLKQFLPDHMHALTPPQLVTTGLIPQFILLSETPYA